MNGCNGDKDEWMGNRRRMRGLMSAEIRNGRYVDGKEIKNRNKRKTSIEGKKIVRKEQEKRKEKDVISLNKRKGK